MAPGLPGSQLEAQSPLVVSKGPETSWLLVRALVTPVCQLGAPGPPGCQLGAQEPPDC